MVRRGDRDAQPVPHVLPRLREPVGAEDDAQVPDHRALDAHHQLDPRPAGLVVLRLVVARLDEVLRASEGHPAVDDQDLAVVAKVWAPQLATSEADREHRRPSDACPAQAFDQVFVHRDAA